MMKFGLGAPGVALYPGTTTHWWEHITTEEMKRIARVADELGFDYLKVPTHLAVTPEDARQLGPRWAEPLTTAGFLLGATSRVTLVPYVCVPMYHPIALAKALGTLDFVSGGRVIPLCLVGYKPWEFDLVGADFAHRGERTDEYLDAMRVLWSRPVASFAGPTVAFEDVVMDPRPTEGTLPLWFGGRTKAALRRIAREADGWISYATPRAQFPEMVRYIVGQPEFRARPRPLELQLYLFEGKRDPITHEVIEQPVVSGSRDFILGEIAAVAAAGCTIVDSGSAIGGGVFQNDSPDAPPPTRDASHFIERMHWFAEEIMPEARRMSPTPLEEL